MSESDLYGWHCDLSDELLAHVLRPEAVIEMQIELGKQAILREVMQREPVWRGLINDGQAFVEFKHRSWHHVQEPFDYEDEDGVMRHSEGWEAARIEVTGRVVEGVRGSGGRATPPHAKETRPSPSV